MVVLFTFYLNCKYHPWGLINDMQVSIYNSKHWHALSHSLHFVRHGGDWRPTHPLQRVSRVPDYLFMYSIQSVLGLSQVRLTPHALLAELSRAKRVSGAPWVRKWSNLPIRENSVITWPYTDRPPERPSVRTTGTPMFSLTLSSYFGSPLIAHQCCDQLTAVKTRYPLISITWPYRGLRCRPIQIEYFSKLFADKLLVFKWSQAHFLNSYVYMLCLCRYGPALWTFWFQTDLGRSRILISYPNLLLMKPKARLVIG